MNVEVFEREGLRVVREGVWRGFSGIKHFSI